jgi:hypothetical protein
MMGKINNNPFIISEQRTGLQKNIDFGIFKGKEIKVGE